MSGDALGEAVAPDALLSGTIAGDVFFNSNATFTAASLYRVALHEFGHALGLRPITEPKSVMFNQLDSNTQIAQSDYLSIRAL